MVFLRSYRQGDEEEIQALVRDVLKEYGLKTNPQVTDRDIQDIDAWYVLNRGVFKVLEDEGRIVGSYGIFTVSDTVCELRKMYVLDKYRGQGLGARLMEDALHEAKALGYDVIILETNSRLMEACSLYRSYGFQEFKPDHLSDRCDIAMRIVL